MDSLVYVHTAPAGSQLQVCLTLELRLSQRHSLESRNLGSRTKPMNARLCGLKGIIHLHEPTSPHL